LWTGVLFALVANVLFVYLADRLVRGMDVAPALEAVATLAVPLLVGVATAFYAPARGGMHALIGGMLSMPLLALLVFGGIWQFALLAGSFCALGGALTERLLRPRTSTR
jgi:hypothetical protein